MFQDVAVDVELTKKKKVKQDKREERPDEHQPLSNTLVLLIVIATASGLCVYMYYVAQRVYRLEQHVEVMSHRYRSSARLATSTPMSTTDHRRQTTDALTTSSAPSTSSIASTLSPKIDQDWTEDWKNLPNDIDEEQQVGSGVPDDDEDAEELSGNDISHESYNYPQSYKFVDEWSLTSWYDQFYKGRHKRSVSDDDTGQTPRRRQQHGRRRAGHRDTSSHGSTASSPADNAQQHSRASGDERRRERRKPDRRRYRSHADTSLSGESLVVRCLTIDFLVCFAFSDDSRIQFTIRKLKQDLSRVYTRTYVAGYKLYPLVSTCCHQHVSFIGNKTVTSLSPICCWIQRDTSRP